MKRRAVLALGVLALAGCSAPTTKTAESAPAAAPVTPPKDNRLKLLAENQTSAKLENEHVLGLRSLPGGTVGEYAARGTAYKLFVIETESAQDAALMLLELKGEMKQPAYIAHMGGYFGGSSAGPLYVYAKGKYVAGVAGLAQDKADLLARQLAVKI